MGKDAKRRLEAIEGTVPIPLDPPRMCDFYSRYPDAIAGTCDVEVPGLVEGSSGHSVHCYLHSPQTEPIPETPEQPRRASGAAR